MKRAILFIALLSSITLFAQQTGSIQGSVADSQSGQIMEMVAVQLFVYADGDSTMVNSYKGEYMAQYSWAEYSIFKKL